MNATKASPQGTDRKTAAVVGVLFIIGTVSGVLGAVIGKPILGAPDYLTRLSANEGQITHLRAAYVHHGGCLCRYWPCAVSDSEEI